MLEHIFAFLLNMSFLAKDILHIRSLNCHQTISNQDCVNYIGKSNRPIKEAFKTKKIITNKLDWTYLAVNEVKNYYLTFFQCQCTVNEFRSDGTYGDIGDFLPFTFCRYAHQPLVQLVGGRLGPPYRSDLT